MFVVKICQFYLLVVVNYSQDFGVYVLCVMFSVFVVISYR